MIKTLLAAALAAVAIGALAIVALHTVRREPSTESATHAAPLPGGWTHLQKGMTTQQVATLVGKPFRQGTNPHFEEKTSAQWAAIQSEASSDAAQTDNIGSSVSLAAIRVDAELEHRIKYLWQYKATSNIDAVLSFDEQGRLMRWDYSPALKPPPHGATAASSAGQSRRRA